MALRRVGRSPIEIRGIAITHLHGDHIGGFPFLVIDGMFNEIRSERLSVVGPTGATERIERFVEAAYGDVVDKDKPFELALTEIAPGAEVELCGARLRGFAARHMDPPEQPLCLRFELPGGVAVAFSGDTAMCAGLFEAADGADLLVAECSALAPPCGRHCSWQDWREALPRVGARRVLLTHLGRSVRESIAALLAEAPADVDLAFADDGLVVEL
jgi:ribonuclease BN (tRNA processing enzyme)